MQSRKAMKTIRHSIFSWKNGMTILCHWYFIDTRP